MADYDVVVAGGGLVGSFAALGFARLGRKVALVEPRVPRRSAGASGFEARTLALNPASRKSLEAHVDWQAFVPHPFNSIRVWEDTGTRAICFDAAEVARDELGWIVEAGRAAETMWAAVNDNAAIDVRVGRRISRVVETHGAVNVVVEAGPGEGHDQDAETISAALLIGADGARSGVRDLSGVEAAPLETPHAALAAVVQTERDSAGVAYQRFLRDGPLALLPLPSGANTATGETSAGKGPGFSSLIWSQPRAEARRRMNLSDAEFALELTEASEGILGRVIGLDERYVFDLDQRVAETFQPMERVLLVGDAARVLHPLAGQGVNIGLEDVAEILDTAQCHRARFEADPGSTGLWGATMRRRRAKALLLVRLMDGFRLGYALHDPLLRLVRNAGVAMLDQSGFLKAGLIREALGLGLSAGSADA